MSSRGKKIGFFIIVFSFVWAAQEEPQTFFPPVTRTTFENGLPVIYQHDTGSAITCVHLLIKGGQTAEPPGKAGLSYLVTRLGLEIPNRRKIQKLMSLASQIYMSGQGDYSLIRISCLSTHLDETLSIFTEVLLNPLFSGIRINNIKELMLNQRQRSEDDSLQVARIEASQKYFGLSGYGASLLGDKLSLEKIKKDDIDNFYSSRFHSKNMIVSVVSDLKEETVIPLVKTYLEKIPAGELQELTLLSPTVPKDRYLVISKETRQVLLYTSFPLPHLNQKNYVRSYLLENLLGTGVHSRLWSLRAKEKIAYSIGSNSRLFAGGGILEAFMETDEARREIAWSYFKKILDSLYEKGIEEKELAMTKAYAKTSFLRSNETKENRSHQLAFFEAFGLGANFIQQIFEELDKVTVEEMNNFIKEILPPHKRLEIEVGPPIAQSTQ
ncbi:MAG: M16 family metallopeptidase [Acidobacteriota bacterium]